MYDDADDRRKFLTEYTGYDDADDKRRKVFFFFSIVWGIDLWRRVVRRLGVYIEVYYVHVERVKDWDEDEKCEP